MHHEEKNNKFKNIYMSPYQFKSLSDSAVDWMLAEL